MRSSISLFVALLCGFSISMAYGEDAVTVSPGGIEGPTVVTDTCPTFSWAPAAAANTYELAVFELTGPPQIGTFEEQSAWGYEVVSQMLPAPSLSWTPPAEACLDQGGAYIWYVRGIGTTDAGVWSQGRQFEVDVQAAAGSFEDIVDQAVDRQLSEQKTVERIVASLRGKNLATGVQRALPVTNARPGEDSAKARHQSRNVRGSGDPQIRSEGVGLLAPKAATVFYPSAFLISNPNGVVFDDPTFDFISGGGDGNIPAEEDGARFMWYPARAALRAGAVQGDMWNGIKVGLYSVALGYNTTASHTAATAMGRHTTASGIASTAMGSVSIASGVYSTAMGSYTTAESGYETVIGRYNTDYDPNSTFDWNDADRLFVIGNGTSDTSTSDALIISKDGRMGIWADDGPNLIINDGDAGNTRPGIQFKNNDVHFISGDDTSAGDEEVFAFMSQVSNQRTKDVALRVHGSAAASWGKYIGLRHDGGTGILETDDSDLELIPGGFVSGTIRLWGETVSIAGGFLHVGLAPAGSTDVCQNTDSRLSTCSSSRRYKEDIDALPLGLETIEKLQPVTFKWKDGGRSDLGFVAEEVEKVDPLLTTYNDEGEIEGVKYKQITAVLVNAIKEQQLQIETQRRDAKEKLAAHQAEIEELHRELRLYRTLAEKVSAIEQQLTYGPAKLAQVSH